MKVLSISDIPVQMLYSTQIRDRFADVGMVISCGDLSYDYPEFMISILDVPLFFVRGNHDKLLEYHQHGTRVAPQGGTDLHRRVIRYDQMLLAGVEGCLRYRPGAFQYSQGEMWSHVLNLAPRLLINRMLYGRFLDIFVTHAPPRGIHDLTDLPHRGINAFRWLLHVFRPQVHFHGHIHVYRPDTAIETQVGETLVVNTFGFKETVFKDRRLTKY